MPDLLINESRIEDVVVLELVGKLTIGEGSVQLRRAIMRLVPEGVRKIVLDLRKVPYIDSSGLGELTASKVAVVREGGRLWLCVNEGKITELLRRTCDYDIDLHSGSVEGALAGLRSDLLEVRCPVHGCGAALVGGDKGEHYFSCGRCGADFHLRLTTQVPDELFEAEVDELFLPTYEGEVDEGIKVHGGPTCIIKIHGRLDLFAAEVLERVWLTVEPPRVVIFDISHMSGEVTEAGLDVLKALCDRRDEDSHAAVYKSHRTARVVPDPPLGRRIYTDTFTAQWALGRPAYRTISKLTVKILKGDAGGG